ncbi:hypothetical protein [Streptomyces soliscabiei]|uniref:hypothetical protein n=1 Tax=Streptomyces soliscabiei TaxID=588897 RepID=UPI0029B43542|nr:hypothetical protein [Streptomyces sp. NY05-11A]MDX2681081.1 hypothetical protein [Streptomyces sp. NY05-11A]
MTTSPRDDVAAMLRDGASYRQIRAELGVSHGTIAATRKHHSIPVPRPEAPTPADPRQQAALERRYPRVVAMLRAGATVQQIQTTTRVSPPTIAKVRRTLGIPTLNRTNTARTIPATITRYSQPYGDGHARWTGPYSGPQPQLWANGTFYTARREIFRLHNGRAPEGAVRTTCPEPGCIAGPHLADRRHRQASHRLDAAYTAIFGPDAP